ncbi:MAG: hypothetical protein A2857_05425 [Candidatus Levybacteria bacterium RIFCSPHIGHO2_01_FULL_36_15]|nr:MAG: hypothetical protein A2857_05425 [Candidatus Levybacteria bacterium RIFCSPHIGHO2_01_FULL_36_15]OGH38493.1 MAG: hypothetical protein A2905_01955 [Candidatus Levybacteria bacterium RIFCSPLOWO2_01_FULL_36_10]
MNFFNFFCCFHHWNKRFFKINTQAFESYFQNNKELDGFLFNFGIGIDSGKVLVVRGGIRGENNNDLVWVGNATNYAVKLAALCKEGYHVYISEDMYKNMATTSKIGSNGNNMWGVRTWTDMNGVNIYRSNWTWTP